MLKVLTRTRSYGDARVVPLMESAWRISCRCSKHPLEIQASWQTGRSASRGYNRTGTGGCWIGAC
jgi:hypothetical protein